MQLPTRGSGMPKRQGRTNGPNPFLEGFPQEDGTVVMDGTLIHSWELKREGEKADFEVVVQGDWVPDTIKKGPRLGEPVDRLVGEVAQVESQLRSAADKLGIGVAVVVSKGRKKGTMIVQYEAKRRNAFTPRNRDDAPDAA